MTDQSPTGDLLCFLGVIFAFIGFICIGFHPLHIILAVVGVTSLFLVIACLIGIIIADERYRKKEKERIEKRNT